MDLKSSLKTIKLHEPVISAILGALVVLSIAFLTFNYFRAKTQDKINTGIQTENTAVTNPTKHTVIQGDSLWKIAETQYKSGYAWVDIAKANNLTNPNILVIGQELTIPESLSSSSSSSETTVSSSSSSSETTVSSSSSSSLSSSKLNQDATESTSIQGESYTIVKGDSLWKISVRAYGDGYRWPQIAKLNNLKNPNRIYPNIELKLPPKS